MENIIIINLDTSSHFYNTHAFIRMLRSDLPHSSITLLTDTNNKSKTEHFRNVNSLHYINTSKIKHMLNSQLISNHFALNAFAAETKGITDKKWDKCYVLDNSSISTYLASSIESDAIFGHWFNSSKVIEYTNHFFELYNELNADNPKYIAIAKVELWQSLLNKTTKDHSFSLNTNAQIEQIVKNRFEKIKANDNRSIIGIDINSLVQNYQIDDIVALINDIARDQNIICLATADHKSQINSIQERIEYQLKSIIYTEESINTIISNFDQILGANNSELCYIAGLFKIRNNLLLKSDQITFNVPFFSNVFIVTSMDDFLDQKIRINSQIELSANHATISGIDVQLDLANAIKRRIVLNECYSFVPVINTYIHDGLLGNKANDEKTILMKIVTLTLNSLRQINSNQKDIPKLLGNIEELFQLSEKELLPSLLCRFFKSKIERINSNDINYNLKVIEDALFELKNALKNLTTAFELALNSNIKTERHHEAT